MVQGLRGRLSEWVTGHEGRQVVERADAFRALGAPDALADRAAAFLEEFCLLDVAEIALREGEDPEHVVAVYFELSDRYAVDGVLTRITELPRSDRWQALARAALRYDLYTALEELTTVVVRTSHGARRERPHPGVGVGQHGRARPGAGRPGGGAALAGARPCAVVGGAADPAQRGQVRLGGRRQVTGGLIATPRRGAADEDGSLVR